MSSTGYTEISAHNVDIIISPWPDYHLRHSTVLHNNFAIHIPALDRFTRQLLTESSRASSPVRNLAFPLPLGKLVGKVYQKFDLGYFFEMLKPSCLAYLRKEGDGERWGKHPPLGERGDLPTVGLPGSTSLVVLPHE